MDKYRHIFSPIKIGGITVKNRIERAPAMPFLATSDCNVSKELIEWERAYAKGGAGIVTIGDSPVLKDPPSVFGHILNLGTDRIINGLSRLAETIQRYGARVSIELTCRTPQSYTSVTDMTCQEIKNVIEGYATAAYRCMSAGMDMIMVHGAHGHFISQFISKKNNLRTDAYGGSFRNRTRFVNEILEAIRDRVGNNLAIEYRISADEYIKDGLSMEEQLEFAQSIQDKIDLMHVSAGHLFNSESIAMMIQPTYIPRGINVHFAECFKKELDIPVATVGSIDIEMAEKILSDNKADIIAMSRALIADPECINKAETGREDTIRPCVRCNTCIDRTHRFFLPVRCAVNPINGREAEFIHLPPPVKKKKVVVIGGGPAGMEAARRAAARGHAVVLFEKEDRLGGNLNKAAALPFKADMKRYLQWAISSTMNIPNLTVKLSTEADAVIVKSENADVLIIAVGSSPVKPDIPGVEGDNVVWAGDVDLERTKIGERVVIAGAGLTGLETALYLARHGKQVILIDIMTLDQIDARFPSISINKLRDILDELHVDTKTGMHLQAINESGLILKDNENKSMEITCDTVVLSLGLRPRRDVVNLFKNLAPDVFVIGDCNNEMGNLYKASSEGFFAAMDI